MTPREQLWFPFRELPHMFLGLLAWPGMMDDWPDERHGAILCAAHALRPMRHAWGDSCPNRIERADRLGGNVATHPPHTRCASRCLQRLVGGAIQATRPIL
jgi:hypothetical protein